MTKLLSIFMSLMLLICTFNIPLPAIAVTSADDFQNKLNAFPQSYHKALEELHKIYPNWEFVADLIPTTFTEAVNAQDFSFNKSVETKYHSWHSMRKGCYNWGSGRFTVSNNGNSYGASREIIAYFMDPRNFLNENNIYSFLQLSFDSASQTVDGLKNIINGTFLDASITNENDKFFGESYAVSILYAANQANINAYELANEILKKQGTDGSELTNGANYNNKTVYNFLNLNTFGDTPDEALENGKNYAYSQGWFTPTDSILAGAVSLSDSFIGKGQDTHFYKNFNVLHPDNLSHQYSQNVAAARDSTLQLKTTYFDKYDLKLVFKIPVYESIPSTISKLPDKNNKLNNYYLSDIKVSGLSPKFDRYTYNYSLSVSGDKTIYLNLPKNATYMGKDKFTVLNGNNKIELPIKSETGYKNRYIINIKATTDAVITISTDYNFTNDKIVTGDANGDGRVNTSDYILVRLYLHKLVTLDKLKFKQADTNNDGKISLIDMSNIQKHILGKITLK